METTSISSSTHNHSHDGDGGGDESGFSGELLGFLALLISCVASGFQFVPLRNKKTKDAFFVQWVQCAMVFVFGYSVNLARGLPPFNLIAAISGVLFATGNVVAVPMISEMGIGVGMLVSGTVQIIVGWCVAHFGMFGTSRQHVGNPVLNYTGVLITLVSGVMFGAAYSMSSGQDSPKSDSDTESNGSKKGGCLTPNIKKLIFLGFAIFLGCCHGMMMTPIVYVQENDPNHSDNVLEYVFSYFSTIFFLSTIYFIGYTIYMRGRPYVKAKLVIPSMAYGLLFCVGMTLLVIANRLLPQTVAFPIAVRFPAIIGACLELFYFKSIKGRKCKIFLIISVLVGVVGVVLIGISS